MSAYYQFSSSLVAKGADSEKEVNVMTETTLIVLTTMTVILFQNSEHYEKAFIHLLATRKGLFYKDQKWYNNAEIH